MMRRPSTVFRIVAMAIAAAVLCPGTISPSAAAQDHLNDDLLILAPYDQSKLALVHGAELWINGVYVGKTPWKGSRTELLDKLPIWKGLPKGEKEQAFRLDDDPEPVFDGDAIGWAELTVLNFLRRKNGTQRGEFYYRIRWGLEWGFNLRSGSGSNEAAHFCVYFPERTDRLENLYNQVRLANYTASDEWFEAIDTYGPGQWWHIRELAKAEPGWEQVLNNWARWKYGVDQSITGEEAWQLFHRICSNADREQYYHTADVAGMMVDLIAEKLDPNRLIDMAVPLLPHFRKYLYGVPRDRTPHYACTDLWIPRDPLETSVLTVADNFPARALPIGHALVRLDAFLDPNGSVTENIIEDRLVPQIVLNARPPLMLLATALGGPDLAKFCIRQENPATATDLGRHPYGVGGMVRGWDGVNKWRYLLAHMDEPKAMQFRNAHRNELLALADTLIEERWSGDLIAELNFLFEDLHRGPDSLAMRYWPRFVMRHSRMDREDTAKQNIEYLLRAEPLPTPAMYVQCFQDYPVAELELDAELYDPLDRLPPEKQKEVFQALLTALDEHRLGTDYNEEFDEKRMREDLQIRLDHGAEPARIRAIHYMKRLQNGDKEPRQRVWSISSKSVREPRLNRPLIDRLSVADDPELRILAIEAIRRFATPEYRKLLETLCQDPSPMVRQAAEKTRRELDVLRMTPASDFRTFAETSTAPEH